MNQRQLLAIQALRALAAIAVTVAHSYVAVADVTARLGVPNPLPGMLTGAAGVDLFFVISGFIMVYTTRGTWGAPGAARNFLLRRVARIAPLYWIATFAVIGTWSLLGTTMEREGADWQTLVSSLGFVFYQRPNGSVEPILGQGWSLNFEMFFYVVFAGAMLLPRRIALLALIPTLIIIGRWPVLAYLFKLPFWLTYVLKPYLWEFSYGILIGWAYSEGIRLARWSAIALVTAGVALIAATAIYPSSLDRSLHWGIPCAMMVAGGAFLAIDGRSIAWRTAAFIGDASYALYLFHGLIIMAAKYWMTPISDFVLLTFTPWGFMLYLTALSVAGSAVIYLTIERPITVWMQSLLTRRSRSLVPSAVPAE